MSFTGWFDKYDLLHVRQGEYSENGPLFLAEYWLLRKLLGESFWIYETTFIGINKTTILIGEHGDAKEVKWFDPNPTDDNIPTVHFSHDNMTGLYVLTSLTNISNRGLSDLPVLRWNSRWWLHPRDIAFYSIMKENIWSKLLLVPFLLLLLVSSLVSCSRHRGITSGKMLWWTRWNALMLHKSRIVRACAKIGFKLATALITMKNDSWAGVSAIYFKEVDHPVNELMRELYE